MDPHNSPDTIAPPTSEPPDEIYELADFGDGRRFTYRTAVFATMNRGDSRRFRAVTDIDYATIRGAAYAYGRRSQKKFVATRYGDVVVVTLGYSKQVEKGTNEQHR